MIINLTNQLTSQQGIQQTMTAVSLYECGIVVAYIPAVASTTIGPGWKSLLGVGRM